MTETPILNWPRIIIQSSLLALALLFIPILLIFTALVIRFSPYVQTFLASSQLKPEELKERILAGWHQNPELENGKYAFVVLGTDELPNRTDTPIMTDTIVLVSVDLNQATIKTMTIPRDLWSEQFKTKINSLYEYGRKQNKAEPYALLLQELALLTPAKIQTVISISPIKLAKLIDTLGGVEITVPIGFTDTQFPRDDVDIKTERDPKKLYETVTFEPGKQVMTGRQALQYMRSRHGTNGQDNDIARAERQTLIVQSIMRTVMSSQIRSNPERMAKLWQFYQQEFDASLSLETMISLLRYRIERIGWQGTIRTTATALTDFTITQSSIPVTHYSQTSKKIEPGILYNPPMNKRDYFGQWVYVATDSAVLNTYISTQLGL